MFGRWTGRLILCAAAVAMPRPGAAQESAAVSVRIVVAPVERLGFSGADDALAEVGEVVTSATRRSRGHDRAERADGSMTVPASRMQALSTTSRSGLRSDVGTTRPASPPADRPGAAAASLETPNGGCAAPTVRRGTAAPVLIVEQRTVDAGVSSSATLVTCTLIAP